MEAGSILSKWERKIVIEIVMMMIDLEAELIETVIVDQAVADQAVVNNNSQCTMVAIHQALDLKVPLNFYSIYLF